MRSKFIQSILLLFCLFASQVLQAQSGNEESIISGQYIVVYKNDALANTKHQMEGKAFEIRQQLMRQEVSSTLSRNGLPNKEVLQVYETALKGFAVKGLTEADVSRLLQDEQIAYIEPDQMVYLFTENKSESNLKIHEVFNSESDASINKSEGMNTLNDPSTECFSLEIDGSPVEFGSSSFGPYSFNVTGQLVLADDGVFPSEDGCEPIINDLTGKIALIKRGTCNFSLKVLHAQNAGAIAAIIYNNVPGFPPSMGAGAYGDLVNIPSMGISDVEGQAVIDALALGTVTATMIQFEDIENTQCTPWGIIRVGGGLSGAGKRAWIIDSGIDMDHPDLNVNAVLSYSVIDGEPSTDDLNGHGTHVAGTVAARDNGFGVIGVAAGAEVIAIKVFPDGSNSTPTSNVIAGLNYVAANATAGDVVNYSIGGGVNQATDDAALAVAAVCPIVIAAGNNSSNANNYSPQRIQAPNVYVISAMDPYDNYASFSNFGNPPINYCAPGVKVVSTFKNGTYGVLDGTSMAAPHVAGLLLLGDICSTSTVNLDPDGNPDPIAEHSTYTSPIDGGTIAGDQTICYGDTPAAFSSIAPPSGAVGELEYQWQISTAIPTFEDIAGAVSETYTHTGIVTETTWFRRLAKVTCQTEWVLSNVVQVDVDPLPIAIISGIIDDFEVANLPNGTDPFGNGIGFITFGDFWAGTTVSITTTLVADTDPLALPGQSGDNYLLRFDANVNDFGGLTHAFENEDVDTWVTQDWSGYQGIAFWLYGQNTGNSLYFEIQDNRNPGSTTFDVELWTHTFADNFSGWKKFALNFDDFTRKDIGNDAPNDGFGRDEVHGWVFGALNTGGETVTYYLDNVMVYSDDYPYCPYTTIQFSAPAGMATYAWSLSVFSGDAAIGSWDDNTGFTPGPANEQDVQVVGVCGSLFTLILTVTDDQGCSASTQQSYVVEESAIEWVIEPQDYSATLNVGDVEAEIYNWLNSMEASSSCFAVNAGYYLPLLQVNSPGDIQEYYISGRANFGPSEFNVTGDLEMADPALACASLLNDLTNKIAIIDRGTCTFTSKVKNAQDASAIAAIVINSNPEQGVITMGGTDPTITIPSLFISYEDGLVLKDAMQQGLVNVTLRHFIDLQPGDYPVLFRATTQCQVIEKTVTLHIEVTPVNLDLNGLVIGENDSECFGATQNITVQDVSVDAGGSLTLIAGNSIIITPGFNVAANAYFHAYIADEYCTLPASLLALESEVENNPALDFNESLSDDLRIFPNPTTGGFTIEMGETFGSNKTSVSIYNLIGELILTNENVLNQAEFNLAGYPNGIYVVLIRNNENTEIRKLIKQ